ncbi:hypothetical protein PQR39_35710 [Paraburkholderia sediminicola]|uniref:hypothetical protein n=1 Tax=Paraburkholderia sediminicola TaxID=458836 RepID=UPI0038B83C60
MQVNQAIPLPVGNALKVFMAPESGAVQWRLMRNTTGTFAGPTDPASMAIYTGDQSTYVVDVFALTNGVAYSYCLFSTLDGENWTASDVFTGTPNAVYADQTVDVLTVIRDRMAAGLAVEVLRKTLTPTTGQIPVLNAPPAFEDTRWPMVSVHVTSDGPAERAIGEAIGSDDWDPEAGMWKEGEGWLSHAVLAVAGWSKNADERIALRKAIRRLMIANLPVFDALGMVRVDLNQSDQDYVSGEYPAPVFTTVCSFSCLAPAYVTDEVGVFTEITVDGEAVFSTQNQTA